MALPTTNVGAKDGGAPPSVLAEYLRSLPYVVVWIFMSSATILFNKWVLSRTEFTFPIALSCWHMLFATVVTQVLGATTSVINKPDVSRDFYLKRVLPIAGAFGVSLITANSAYMYLSVAFIQMIKACTPMVVLLLSFSLGLEAPSGALVGFISVVCMGVMISSVGEVFFNMTGFVLQVIAVIVEASRLVMIQLLVSGTVKVDALGSLYLYAPPAFAFTFVGFLLVEAPTFTWAALWDLGIPLLVLNACTAFGLNLASVTLVKNTSSLVLTLSGVAKDILLVIFSVTLHGAVVSPLQWFGFSLSTFGIFLFNMYKKHRSELDMVVQRVLTVGSGGNTRRLVTIGAAALLIFIVYTMLNQISDN